ncbi:MAG TPA: hypothetical protein ENG77_00535, partial [Chromatiales bacterium]|nr:hypothetical protein [Chromatiales bacterium]
MTRQIFRGCRIALALAGLTALFAGTAWANAGASKSAPAARAGAPVVQVTGTAHREGGLLWVGCGISKKSY